MRETYTGLLGARAFCQDCPWKTDGKNALGLAAQHHDRTTHCVTWEQELSGRYGGGPTAEYLARWRAAHA